MIENCANCGNYKSGKCQVSYHGVIKDAGHHVCSIWEKGEPVTNFQRITESPEKLAHELYNSGDEIPFCKNRPECERMNEENIPIPEEDCLECLIDWLKRPEEEK